eukprot:scaffold255408_cov36-Tisochrysis_lutea.AAC.1
MGGGQTTCTDAERLAGRVHHVEGASLRCDADHTLSPTARRRIQNLIWYTRYLACDSLGNGEQSARFSSKGARGRRQRRVAGRRGDAVSEQVVIAGRAQEACTQMLLASVDTRGSSLIAKELRAKEHVIRIKVVVAQGGFS